MSATTRVIHLTVGGVIGLALALPSLTNLAQADTKVADDVVVAQAGNGDQQHPRANKRDNGESDDDQRHPRGKEPPKKGQQKSEAKGDEKGRQQQRDEQRNRPERARGQGRDDANQDQRREQRTQRERSDQDQDERGRGDRDRGDRNQQDRNQADRERGDRDRQDRNQADRERGDRDRQNRDQADRERGDRDRQNRDQADRERGDRDRQNRDQADRERGDRDRQDRERADRERGDRERAEREREKADRERNREKAERDRDRERAERERDRERAERERDRERAERERDREKAGRERERKQEDRAGRREDDRERRERRRQAREERRGNIEEIRRERKERREEGGRIVIEEPGNRRIIREGNRTIIRHDESDRFRRRARDVDVRRRDDGERVTTITRPNGVRVVTIEDRDGRLLRRIRRFPDGREVVLIDNTRHYHRHRDRRDYRDGGLAFFLDLAMPSIHIDRHRYIVDAGEASVDDLYETFVAPPVVEIEREYSLDEIRYNYPLRARMRSVNLNTINFEFGSWELDDQAYDELDEVARAMRRALDRNPDEVFLIEGHTDAVGSDEDNLTLADRRAETVAIALSDEFDVPPENLTTQGYGEQYLLVDTQEPERRNRRVTIRRITPLLSGNTRR